MSWRTDSARWSRWLGPSRQHAPAKARGPRATAEHQNVTFIVHKTCDDASSLHRLYIRYGQDELYSGIESPAWWGSN